MPKYKLVLFDSDGTLVDSLPWFRAAFNEFAVRHGMRPVTGADHERLRELTTGEMLRHMRVPLLKMPALLTAMRRLMAEHLREFSIFEGVADSLARLSAHGVKLGVVSSNSRENVRGILGPVNAALISFYACGASMLGKPSKLRAVLKAARISAEDAIYIGDEVRDAEAARKVGMAYGAVAWGYHRIETLKAQNPTEVFLKPAEIGERLG